MNEAARITPNETLPVTPEEDKKTQTILDKYDNSPKSLVRVLQEIQAELGYVPAASQRLLARRMGVSESYVYGLVTFYNFFRLYPPGKHKVSVCLGTACYVKGSKNILKEFADRYHLLPGQTTPDRKFSLDIVRCVGCCAIGPVMSVDGTVYGRMKPEKVKEILRTYE